MASRACDFSSFKRPPRPPNTDSPYTNSDKTSSLRSNELNSSTEGYSGGMDYNNRRFMTSQSIDPNIAPRGNYENFGGSMSTFKDAMSPNSISASSAQNVDSYSSFKRPPKANHTSTIDRTTLPHDRRQKVPKFIPNERDSPRQDESGVGSGLVFLDGGKRGVMNADSQHSLDDSLSGRRMDRSLVRAKNVSGPASNTISHHERTPPYNNAMQYSQGGSTMPIRNHNIYAANCGTPYDVYYTPYDNGGDTLPANSNKYPTYNQDNVPLGSHHNVSSGESGIAGCEFNTLGMSYDTYGPATVNGSYGYNRSASQPGRGYEMQTEEYDDGQQDIEDNAPARMQQTIESRVSQGGSSKSSRGDGSLAHRGEYTQRTLLLPTDSALLLGAEHGQQMCDQNSEHKSSITRMNSRTSSQPANKAAFNVFNKNSDKNDDVYGGNMYGSKGKKSSKHSSHTVLGSNGLTTTGLGFNKHAYSSSKRSFCPKWQCIALTFAVALVLTLSIGLILYLYVWPSVLQPLVDSSKPVDGEWGGWKPWFQCSASCGQGTQNRTRECDSPTPEDGGRLCQGPKYQMQVCNAPIECPDCSRICDVGTLSKDCRSCTCEGHVISGTVTDEYENPLSGVKVYKGDGATLLLAGTDSEGKFQFEGVCSNGDNELRLEKEMYRISRVNPEQSKSDQKTGFVSFSMTRLFLPSFSMAPTNEERLADQKVVLCCKAESEQPPTRYVWYKDNSRLDPSVYHYSLSDPSLVLPELMVWDGGEYACEAKNEAGTVRSETATLTVYGNWTDLCDPEPKEKYVPLPDGCSQTTFNTGSCGKEKAEEIVESSDDGSFPHCIARDQYPNDAHSDICTAEYVNGANRVKYCCKPTEEEEVSVTCKLQNSVVYNMSLKRILACGCTLC